MLFVMNGRIEMDQVLINKAKYESKALKKRVPNMEWDTGGRGHVTRRLDWREGGFSGCNLCNASEHYRSRSTSTSSFASLANNSSDSGFRGNARPSPGLDHRVSQDAALSVIVDKPRPTTEDTMQPTERTVPSQHLGKVLLPTYVV